MQEKYVFVALADGYVHGEDARKLSFQIDQLMIVGGKEGAQGSVEFGCKMLGNGPGQGQPVIGACAPAYFIENNQAVRGCLAQDAGCLHHFDHEGALALSQVVGGTHAREQLVYDAKLCPFCRNKGPCLGHEAQKGHLPQDGGLAGHVWACQKAEALIFIQGKAVGHKVCPALHFLHHGMAAVLDIDIGAVRKMRPGPAFFAGHLRQSLPVVNVGNVFGHGHYPGTPLCHLCPQLLVERVFQGAAFFLRLDNVVFQVLQALRDIALGIDQGLPAHKVSGQILCILGLGYLIVIAKDPVAAQLQPDAAGPCLIPCHLVAELLLGMGGKIDPFVELLVVAVQEDAAFGNKHRGRIGQGRIQEIAVFCHIVPGGQHGLYGLRERLFVSCAVPCAGQFLQYLLYGRQYAQGVAQ